ncbi:hypothetical protein ACNQPY_05080 [Mycobacteroides abscessus]|uniref:hypothetical protein n=1 Tax=Mycobacteroides abscessus TaxID=36809 RepID=UPI003AAEF51E
MNKAERLWNLRDGVLAWLYELRLEGATIAEAKPAAFMEATSWSSTEVTREEVNAVLEWLMEEGYVDGTGTMQRIVLRPKLTPYGEKYAASGKSVRDLPGVAEVQSPYLHIEGSSGVAIAFSSPGAMQTVNIRQTVDQARTLADAIEQALPALADEQVRAAGEELVSDIRRESNSDSPSPGRLKMLATAAMTSIATAAGTEVGKMIIETALPLIS